MPLLICTTRGTPTTSWDIGKGCLGRRLRLEMKDTND